MKMYNWLRNAVISIGGAVLLLSNPSIADESKKYPVFNKGYNTVETSTDMSGRQTYRLTTNNRVDFENFRITHNGINNYFPQTDKIKGVNRLAIGAKDFPVSAVGVFKPGVKAGYAKGGLRYSLNKTGFLDVVTDGSSLEAGLVYPMTLVKKDDGSPLLTGRVIAGAEHYLSGKKRGKTDLTSELQVNAMLTESLLVFGRASFSGSTPRYEIGGGIKF